MADEMMTSQLESIPGEGDIEDANAQCAASNRAREHSVAASKRLPLAQTRGRGICRNEPGFSVGDADVPVTENPDGAQEISLGPRRRRPGRSAARPRR